MDKSCDSEPPYYGKNDTISQKTIPNEDDEQDFKAVHDSQSLKDLSPNQQISLNSFSNEQKVIVKALITKLLLEQKQKLTSENPGDGSSEEKL